MSEQTFNKGLAAGYALATADAAVWLLQQGLAEAATAIAKGAHHDAVARANGAGR